jgi:hypothetical protein
MNQKSSLREGPQFVSQVLTANTAGGCYWGRAEQFFVFARSLSTFVIPGRAVRGPRVLRQNIKIPGSSLRDARNAGGGLVGIVSHIIEPRPRAC